MLRNRRINTLIGRLDIVVVEDDHSDYQYYSCNKIIRCPNCGGEVEIHVFTLDTEIAELKFHCEYCEHFDNVIHNVIN